jgi:Ser/Thr protein kinase RdoA (MazF antagonist)
VFGNREFFEQLRIEPFFVRSAERNPQARGAIDDVIQRLRAPGQVLVHGDYSPKNMLVRDERVVILDWEVAHWGEPRFDLAFCVSHLLLSGWRFGNPPQSFRDACNAFAAAYSQLGPISVDDTATTAVIACLLLARLDGDSPVNYLHELDVDGIRAKALRLLLEPAPPWTELFSESMY